MSAIPGKRGQAYGDGGTDDIGAVLIEALRTSLHGLSPRAAEQRLDDLDDALRRLRFELLEDELQASIAAAKPSPETAAGMAALQRLLDRLNENEDTRLLSAGEISCRAGRGRNWAAQNARSGALIRVVHAGKIYYPAFQIDPGTRAIRPWVQSVIAVLDELDLDGRSFAVWAATPSPLFDGDPPAAHAGDANFLTVTAKALAEVG